MRFTSTGVLSINTIFGVKCTLFWSNKLKIKGTVDCVKVRHITRTSIVGSRRHRFQELPLMEMSLYRSLSAGVRDHCSQVTLVLKKSSFDLPSQNLLKYL